MPVPLSTLFAEPKPIIGPVQLLPLPGSSAFGGSMQAVVEAALEDAQPLPAGGADGLVVSGPRTGAAAGLVDVESVRGLGADVVLGSGVTAGNAELMIAAADGAIVATAFRPGGDLSRRVDRSLVERVMDVVRR